MTRNLSMAVIAVAVLVLGGWFYINSQTRNFAPPLNVQDNTKISTPQEGISSSSAPSSVSENNITITQSGISPQTLTIKAGDSVVFVNNDTGSHQIASDPHPVHTSYPPLNSIGLLKAGDSKSLSFPSPGTYKYHDHLKPSLGGTITIE